MAREVFLGGVLQVNDLTLLFLMCTVVSVKMLVSINNLQ